MERALFSLCVRKWFSDSVAKTTHAVAKHLTAVDARVFCMTRASDCSRKKALFLPTDRSGAKFTSGGF
jgi:hypothetical protein